jgi:hypothetical protein
MLTRKRLNISLCYTYIVWLFLVFLCKFDFKLNYLCFFVFAFPLVLILLASTSLNSAIF